MNKQLMAGAKKGAEAAVGGNGQPQVSIAIPKAKPKAPAMERVSPGVYRDNKGNLVRSRGGQQSKENFLPGNVADLAGRLAGGLRIQPVGEPTPGGIADSVKGPSVAEGLIERLKPMPVRGGNMDDNIRRIIDMFGKGPMGRPVPKQPMDIDPGFAADPNLFDGSLYERAIAAATPQIPRSGGSIADLLRRR